MAENNYHRQAARITIEDLAAADALEQLLDEHVPPEYTPITHFERGKFANQWQAEKTNQILSQDSCTVVLASTTVEIPILEAEHLGPYGFLDKVDGWLLPLQEAIKAQSPAGFAPPLVDGYDVPDLIRERTTPIRTQVDTVSVAEPYEGGITLGRSITYADFLWGMAHRWLRKPMRMTAGHKAVHLPMDQIPPALGHAPLKVLMAHSTSIVAIPESQALHNRRP